MNETYRSEKDQWIPWEIAYSLKSKSRADNRSKRNAILLVVLPNKMERYDYVDSYYFSYFEIIKRNLNNLHTPYLSNKLKNGNCSQSYMLRCNWDNFMSNVNSWIDAALEIRDKGDKYNIVIRP